MFKITLAKTEKFKSLVVLWPTQSYQMLFVPFFLLLALDIWFILLIPFVAGNLPLTQPPDYVCLCMLYFLIHIMYIYEDSFIQLNTGICKESVSVFYNLKDTTFFKMFFKTWYLNGFPIQRRFYASLFFRVVVMYRNYILRTVTFIFSV